jgi:hypothetical protein
MASIANCSNLLGLDIYDSSDDELQDLNAIIASREAETGASSNTLNAELQISSTTPSANDIRDSRSPLYNRNRNAAVETTVNTEPHLQMPTNRTFSTPEEAMESINNFMGLHGYTLTKKRSKNDKLGNLKTIYLQCNRGGTYRTRVGEGDRRRNRGTRSDGCPFDAVLRYSKEHLSWSLDVRDPAHNHEPAPPSNSLLCNRGMDAAIETTVNTGPHFQMPSPPTNRTFSTPEEAIESINNFTGLHGYALTRKRSKNDKLGNMKTVYLRCNRGGIYKTRIGEGDRKRNKCTRSGGCPFDAVLRYSKELLTWSLDIRDPAHNHEPAPPSTHPSLRRQELTARAAQIEAQISLGAPTRQILSGIYQEAQSSLKAQDIRNLRKKLRRRVL